MNTHATDTTTTEEATLSTIEGPNGRTYELRDHGSYREILLTLMFGNGNIFVTSDATERDGDWIVEPYVDGDTVLSASAARDLVGEFVAAIELAEFLNAATAVDL